MSMAYLQSSFKRYVTTQHTSTKKCIIRAYQQYIGGEFYDDFRVFFRRPRERETINYFIFDSKGGGYHGDIDFVKYEWTPSRYNKVREDDLFIYRRPGTSSETREFYFFGACKIRDMNGETRYSASFSKTYPFKDYLTSMSCGL